MVRPTALPIVLALLVACQSVTDDTDPETDTDTEVGTGVPLQDADLDGVVDDDDNCPSDENTDQADADSDGLGDVCDACPNDADEDADNDGVCGDVDVCPDVADAGQQDSDVDGQGDACDPCPNDPLNDADNDGVCGDVDGCPEVDDDQTDSDGDGIGDACDVCTFDADNDIDNDDVCGDVDICPAVSDTDQVDTDSDGFGDACECATDTFREYIGGTCAACPSAGLDATAVDFDSTDTRYDSASNTVFFALADDVQIVSATLTVRAISFDEYGYEGEDLQDTLTTTPDARIVSFDLDELANIDVFAEGIEELLLELTDACGNTVTLTDVQVDGTP